MAWKLIWIVAVATLAATFGGAAWLGYITVNLGRPAMTYGDILVEGPQVYTRERLVNDRYREDEWLTFELDKSKSVKFGLQARIVTDRDSSIELNARFEKPTTQSASETRQKTSDAKTVSPNKATVELEPAPESDLRDRAAYREQIRDMMIENQLDDRHDLLGNSLYRLKFDETIIPGKNSRLPAQVEISVIGPPALFDIPSVDDIDFVNPKGRLDQIRHITSIKDLSPLQRAAWQNLYDGWLRSLGARFDQARGELREAYHGNHFTPDDYEEFLAELRSSSFPCDVPLRDLKIMRDANREYQTQVNLDNSEEFDLRLGAWHAAYKALIAKSIKAKFGLAEHIKALKKDLPLNPAPADIQKFITTRLKIIAKLPTCSNSAEVKPLASEVVTFSHEEQEVFDHSFDQAFQDRISRTVLGAGPRFLDKIGNTDVSHFASFISQFGPSSSQSPFQFGGYSILVPLAGANANPNWMRPATNAANAEPASVGTPAGDPQGTGAPTEAPFDTIEHVPIGAGSEILASGRALNLLKLAAPDYDFQKDFAAAAKSASDNPRPNPVGNFAADIPVGLFNFIRKVAERVDVYSYAVTPKETAKRLSRQSSSSNGKKLATAFSATAGALDAAADAGMTSNSSGSLEDLLRPPLVVGYGDQKSEALGKFGWVAEPEEMDNSEPGNAHHTAAQHSLTALVSLPGWWNGIAIKVDTFWIGQDGKHADQDKKSQIFTVPLPVEYETLEMTLLPDAQGHGPEVVESRLGKLSVTACAPASILIPGRRLWRSSVVTINGQPSSGIYVLPDMKGIIATFQNINMPHGWANQLTPYSAQVTIWTSQGNLTLKRRASINPPPKDAKGQAPESCSRESVANVDVAVAHRDK